MAGGHNPASDWLGYPSDRECALTLICGRHHRDKYPYPLPHASIAKGDVIVFQRKGKDFVVMRSSSKKERLEEVMDWNPERTENLRAHRRKT
jgi:hypothetical protein